MCCLRESSRPDPQLFRIGFDFDKTERTQKNASRTLSLEGGRRMPPCPLRPAIAVFMVADHPGGLSARVWSLDRAKLWERTARPLGMVRH